MSFLPASYNHPFQSCIHICMHSEKYVLITSYYTSASHLAFKKAPVNNIDKILVFMDFLFYIKIVSPTLRSIALSSPSSGKTAKTPHPQLLCHSLVIASSHIRAFCLQNYNVVQTAFGICFLFTFSLYSQR